MVPFTSTSKGMGCFRVALGYGLIQCWVGPERDWATEHSGTQTPVGSFICTIMPFTWTSKGMNLSGMDQIMDQRVKHRQHGNGSLRHSAARCLQCVHAHAHSWVWGQLGCGRSRPTWPWHPAVRCCWQLGPTQDNPLTHPSLVVEDTCIKLTLILCW